MDVLDLPSVARSPDAYKAAGPSKALPLPWRSSISQAVGAWLASRVILAVLTYFATLFQASWTNKNAVMTPHLLLLSWQRWDADYYLDASLHGYYKPELTAFFPLYPLLIHGATALLGTTHVLIAALLISNLATLGAFIGISCLVMQEGGDLRTAGQTLLVLAAYPLAFFLAAPYAEGVFLACAVWALLAARRGWWYWAALLGFLGALSRPTGVILLLPLVYEFGRQQGWWGQAMAFARQRDWGQLWAAIRQWSWRKAGALLERRSKSQAASPKTGRRARTCKLLMVAQRRRSKRFLRSPR